MAAALNNKHQWAIEPGEFIGAETLGLALSQPDPGNTLSVADFVVDGNSVAPEMDPTGQFTESFAGRSIDQLVQVQRDAGSEKILPTSNRFELGPNVCLQRLRRCCLQGPAGSAPQLIQLSQDAPQPVLVGVSGLALPERVGQHVARSRLQLRRHLVLQSLELGLQLEPEVGSPPLDCESLVFARSAQNDPGRARGRILVNQIVRESGAFDSGARGTKPVREIAKRPSHRSPASCHRGFGNSGLLPIGSMLIDHEIEGHDSGKQIGPTPANVLGRVGELFRQRQLQRPVN